MSSKARTIAKGSILGMIEFFSVSIVTLAMTPFIIRSLGDNMYGLWIFVGSFLGYYGLTDFGLNSAVQRFLSRAIGANDKKEANRVINTALAIFTITGFVALIFSIIIALVFPLLIKNITEVGLFRKIILILGFNFAIGCPLRVFAGILSANLRYDLGTTIELIKLTLRTILIIILLKAGHGLMALALITLVADIGGYIFKYFLVKHLYKNIVFSRALIDKSLIKPLFGYSIYTFVAQIANQLRFGVDNLVITAFIGLGSVTLYSIASRLIQYFMAFISSALGLLTPLFSQYEAKNDYDSIREKVVLTTKISSYLSFMIGGILIVFGRAFIQRWVGVQYLSAYPILLVLVIPIIFALMQAPSVQVFYGISKHKFFAISNSIEGIANLILSLILVKKYGLIGVALGTAIPMIIIKLFVQPLYICKVIKLGTRKYYFKVLMPTILNSCIVLVILWLAAKNFIYANYFNLAALVLGFIVVFSGCIFFLGFNLLERNYFKKVIFNIN